MVEPGFLFALCVFALCMFRSVLLCSTALHGAGCLPQRVNVKKILSVATFILCWLWWHAGHGFRVWGAIINQFSLLTTGSSLAQPLDSPHLWPKSEDYLKYRL